MMQIVRACYLAMPLIAWLVIVPLAVASLLIGIVQSLGTPWGLFRHWWVLLKLLVTVFATTVLLLKMQLIGTVAGAAAETPHCRGRISAAPGLNWPSTPAPA